MTNYAGFWKRFLGWLIDAILMGVLTWIILTPILAAIGIASGSAFPFSSPEDFDPATLIATLSAMFGISWVIQTVVWILYHTLMESSKYQGSVGKMALGIKVTDANGAALDFVKALIRNVCKIVSNFTLLIGYIIAGFTAKKQALHDIIAGTLVVNK